MCFESKHNGPLLQSTREMAYTQGTCRSLYTISSILRLWRKGIFFPHSKIFSL